MFHKYPQELLRGWLRQHNIRDDQVTIFYERGCVSLWCSLMSHAHAQVEFCVLPPTPQGMSRSRPAA